MNELEATETEMLARQRANIGRVRWLYCACCGERCRGRQWWNRDTGWGLCANCIDYTSKSETPEEHRQCYGERGVHYDIAED